VLRIRKSFRLKTKRGAFAHRIQSGIAHADGGDITATSRRIRSCRRQGLPGLPWRWHSRPSCCRTGPSPLAVRLIAGHGAWGGREKLRPGRPDAARLEGGLRLPGGCLEASGDPGPEEGRQPGIIQRAGAPAGGQGPGTSRWSPPVRSRLPGRRIVSGVTSSRSPWRRALDITPSRVASRALSAQFSFGWHGCRRCSTASWWRRIKISAVRQVSSRRDSRSHVAVRVIRRKANCRHMTGDHHGQAAGMASLLVIAADGILGTHRRPRLPRRPGCPRRSRPELRPVPRVGDHVIT
jgi:hypothetical protein